MTSDPNELFDRIERTAEFIAQYRIKKRPLPPLPGDLVPQTQEESYAIQARLHQYLDKAFGDRVAGYKVGCMRKSSQALYGIDGPIFGRMRSSTIFDSPAEVALASFVRPGTECEIVVEIGRDTDGFHDDFSETNIGGFIRSMRMGLELVDERYEQPSISYGAFTLIADDDSHAGLVMGPPVVDWHALDFRHAVATVQVEGRQIASICVADAIGHPLKSVMFLAEKLRSLGSSLKVGDIVSTGNLIGLHSDNIVRGGETTKNQIIELGFASAKFV